MSPLLPKLRRYGVATIAVGLAFVLTAAIPALRDRAQFMLFVGAVAVSAWYGGWGPGLSAAALAAFSAHVFLVQPIGILSFGVGDVERIATFLIVAIPISFLQSRRLKAEKEGRTNAQELDAARLIQQKLFPSATPAIRGFDVAGTSRPARTTGGDYYDFIQLPDGRWAFVLGDVSGHGLGPAFVMAEVRAYVRATLQTQTDPGQVLTICNRIICEDLDHERFITLFLGVLDPDSRQFVHATAGHEGYLLNEKNEIAKLECSGLPLGIESSTTYESSFPILIEAGQIVVLLTDGVTETMEPSGRLFGTQRAFDVVGSARGKSAAEIIERLWGAAQLFRDGEPPMDDFSAVIIKATCQPAFVDARERDGLRSSSTLQSEISAMVT